MAKNTPQTPTQPENEAPAVAAPSPAPANEATPSNYVRPSTAPNGEPFPSTSGYVKTTPTPAAPPSSSPSSWTTSATPPTYSPSYTKPTPPQPLRTFFIEERSQLPLTALEAGSYTIRYVQLDTGETVTSETIALSDSQKEATVYLQRAKE